MGQHDLLEDCVFKAAENAQPVSGNQEPAAGSKVKENGGFVHTEEVLSDFTTAGQIPVQHQENNMVGTAGHRARN